MLLRAVPVLTAVSLKYVSSAYLPQVSTNGQSYSKSSAFLHTILTDLIAADFLPHVGRLRRVVSHVHHIPGLCRSRRHVPAKQVAFQDG